MQVGVVLCNDLTFFFFIKDFKTWITDVLSFLVLEDTWKHWSVLLPAIIIDVPSSIKVIHRPSWHSGTLFMVFSRRVGQITPQETIPAAASIFFLWANTLTMVSTVAETWPSSIISWSVGGKSRPLLLLVVVIPLTAAEVEGRRTEYAPTSGVDGRCLSKQLCQWIDGRDIHWCPNK